MLSGYIHSFYIFITNIYLAFTLYKTGLDDKSISGDKSDMVSDLMDFNSNHRKRNYYLHNF